mmetsp:Transcript_17552/g.41336  ORF Transcript_17552/g.41336 Transcript_17552/m.41336 type:complete len:827 (+) Transcript_17552:50-2530(+)
MMDSEPEVGSLGHLDAIARFDAQATEKVAKVLDVLESSVYQDGSVVTPTTVAPAVRDAPAIFKAGTTEFSNESADWTGQFSYFRVKGTQMLQNSETDLPQCQSTPATQSKSDSKAMNGLTETELRVTGAKMASSQDGLVSEGEILAAHGEYVEYFARDNSSLQSHNPENFQGHHSGVGPPSPRSAVRDSVLSKLTDTVLSDASGPISVAAASIRKRGDSSVGADKEIATVLRVGSSSSMVSNDSDHRPVSAASEAPSDASSSQAPPPTLRSGPHVLRPLPVRLSGGLPSPPQPSNSARRAVGTADSVNWNSRSTLSPLNSSQHSAQPLPAIRNPPSQALQHHWARNAYRNGNFRSRHLNGNTSEPRIMTVASPYAHHLREHRLSTAPENNHAPRGLGKLNEMEAEPSVTPQVLQVLQLDDPAPLADRPTSRGGRPLTSGPDVFCLPRSTPRNLGSGSGSRRSSWNDASLKNSASVYGTPHSAHRPCRGGAGKQDAPMSGGKEGGGESSAGEGSIARPPSRGIVPDVGRPRSRTAGRPPSRGRGENVPAASVGVGGPSGGAGAGAGSGLPGGRALPRPGTREGRPMSRQNSGGGGPAARSSGVGAGLPASGGGATVLASSGGRPVSRGAGGGSGSVTPRRGDPIAGGASATNGSAGRPRTRDPTASDVGLEPRGLGSGDSGRAVNGLSVPSGPGRTKPAGEVLGPAAVVSGRPATRGNSGGVCSESGRPVTRGATIETDLWGRPTTRGGAVGGGAGRPMTSCGPPTQALPSRPQTAQEAVGKFADWGFDIAADDGILTFNDGHRVDHFPSPNGKKQSSGARRLRGLR